MSESIHHRPKSFVQNSYKTDNNKINRRCKGIKKCVLEELQHKDYDNCLNNREKLTKKQKIFRSDKHKVYTVEVEKIALSYNDDKCFIMNDNIHNLTHGHCKIKELQNNISVFNNGP